MTTSSQLDVQPIHLNRAQTCRALLACSLALALGGCDTDEAVDDQPVAHERNVQVLDIDWDDVALPQAVAAVHELNAPAEPALPTAGNKGAQYELETFSFARSDAFAVTMATGGLFAPTPADIMPLDQPPNDRGMFAGISLRDEHGEVIGYGSKQLVIDYDAALSADTFTLTIPDRGTLVLAQDEDISHVLGEVDDMLANQEYVRTYEQPLVLELTVEGTGEVLGGTGEFADAKGTWREIAVYHEFDLLTLEHTFDDYIQVALLPN